MAKLTNVGQSRNEGPRAWRPANDLQGLPNASRWSVSDSSLLQGLAAGGAPTRGRRGAGIHVALSWARRAHLSAALLFVIGLVAATADWIRQGRLSTPQGLFDRLFVGFGAGAEEELFQRYAEEAGGHVARVNQDDVSSFGHLSRARYWDVIVALIDAHRVALQTVRKLPCSVASAHDHFMTYACMRLGRYAFLRAWFECLKRGHQDVKEACFLASDTAAFAAVDAGLSARHLQHGFIRHSLVLPDFTHVDALTYDEAEHFRHRLPAARVRIVRPESAVPIGGASGVLIASVYERLDEMRKIVPFLEWAKAKALVVWVRPHPRETGDFWLTEIDRGLVKIEDRDESFYSAMGRLQPRVVISWYSTALADALEYGLIPLAIAGESNPAVRDMVFPIMDRTLQWPRHSSLVEDLMFDDELFRATVTSLRLKSSEPVSPHAITSVA